ncbi:MAG: hypothetical protein V4662_06675 [Verrucomicrobiota bacterium]
MKHLLALFCLWSISVFPALAASPNEEARYLAGLNIDGSALEPWAREPAWQQHASEFQRAWIDVEERQLGPIRGWMPTTLDFVYSDPSPLFYPFSGPDMLYAHAFFPNASTYILCGREPVGDIPQIESLDPAVRTAALANLRKSLNAILSFSFFITADMKNDLNASQLSGTLPVMMVFLARSGCQISSVELVKLSSGGDLTKDKSKTPGVKIVFHGTTGRTQTLYYFTTDLSDWGIKSNPGFMAFCKKQGRGNGFTKAASYLMHMGEFSSVRDFLLTNTRNIVQDDSGIPLRYFPGNDWVMGLYGNYPGPIELFAKHDQPDLRDAFTHHKTGDLPFGFGYQWGRGVSSLIVGTALSSVPRAGSMVEPVQNAPVKAVPVEE